MYNSVLLHSSQQFYSVTHQGKAYQCSRVSSIIEKTSETPVYLKRWMVNCAIEAIVNDGKLGDDFKSLKRLGWQAHQIKSQQALDVGTKVHGWINAGTMDKNNCDEESLACWKAYTAFTAQYIPIPIAQEIALYDIDNIFAGTCDYIGLLGARMAHSAQNKPIAKPRQTIYIIDWKTSKAINISYRVQIVVYKHMIQCLIKEFLKYPTRFNANTTRIINDIILAAGKNPKIVCGIVRLPKKPSTRKAFEFVELTAKEEKAYLKEFLLMAKLHNLRTKETENAR